MIKNKMSDVIGETDGKPILNVGLRAHSYLSGGLRSRNLGGFHV